MRALSWWRNMRLTLRIRTDSVAALVLATRLKTRGVGCSIIAREIALDVAASTYEPLIGEHLPGISNETSDMLSRRFQPSSTFVLPQHLAHIPETHLPIRTKSYFRALSLTSPMTPS